MSKRKDDFPQAVRTAVARRASHHCSFRDCPQVTVGPSDEGPLSVATTGVAAHIHAASPGPGARRYLATMSSDERKDISNAIWLCQTHATLIDRDDVIYTADVLRSMKNEHEAACRQRQHTPTIASKPVPDLIAIGPNVVFMGDFLGVEGGEWSFQLEQFVDGDLHTLTRFIDRYEQIAASDRYVLINSLGDGWLLKGAPSVVARPAGGHIVRCSLLPSTDRIRAADLPQSFALTAAHGLTLTKGNWAMVSGVDALPKQVKTCLSFQRGESPMFPDAGSRFAEYYRLLSGSIWLNQFLKLEVLRLAAIPRLDTANSRLNTPLLCVERVFNVEILATTPTNDWLPIRVDLDIKGLGRWKHELSICVPKVHIVRPSLKELLAGPLPP